MRNYKIIIFFVVTAIFICCISYTKPFSKKVFKDGVNMLYGEITRDDLFSEYPAWYDDYMEYKPDSTIIKSLALLHSDLKIEIFLGTWCSDSRREVPKFFKTVDESKFVDDKQIQLWAVDRNKSLDSGLTDEKEIFNVATFIVYRDDREIGRIIEQPDHDNIETDLLYIIREF